MANTSKNTQQTVKTEKKISASVLDKLNALKISESVKNSSERKSIFKPAYNDKQLRTKYRNMLIKTQKVEIEDGTKEIQKGLIPNFLLQIQKGKIEDAQKTLSQISEICKKVYIAEDSFKSAEDYFSGNRSVETQEILKTFIEVAQELI